MVGTPLTVVELEEIYRELIYESDCWFYKVLRF